MDSLLTSWRSARWRFVGSWSQTTAPSSEPITTAEAKTHLEENTSDRDTYIDALVAAARAQVEEVTGRQLITATWKLFMDVFPPDEVPIWLPRPPLGSVTSIQYVDNDGNTQTWASSDYDVDSQSEPARITPAFDESYPETRQEINAVTITYTAGYGSSGSSVPAPLLHAIKFLVGTWYQNRETVIAGSTMREIPHTVDMLLEPYKVREIG